MTRLDARGYSLLELAIVIVVMGIGLAISVPAYRNYRESNSLKAATENIAGQLRLAREKAISTGSQEEIHFSPGYAGADYHIHNNGVVGAKWLLPSGVSFYYGVGTNWMYRMTKDGRCFDSGLIILQDSRGRRDTVSVQVSGLIITQ